MKFIYALTTCAIFAFIPAVASAQAAGAPASGSTAQGGQGEHKPMDSSQAMASAGFKTLPASEVVGMSLYNSKGDVFGDVKQVIMNEKGRDSVVVKLRESSDKDVVIPIDNVVIHSERLFTHGVADGQLQAMPSPNPEAQTPVADSATVEIGAEN